MHIIDCLNGELTEKDYGGHADIFQAIHKGRQVAVKIVRLYLTSDFDKCLSVKMFPFTSRKLLLTSVYRYSVEKPPCGGTSDTRISYHC